MPNLFLKLENVKPVDGLNLRSLEFVVTGEDQKIKVKTINYEDLTKTEKATFDKFLDLLQSK